jgi:hypothetical protein
MTDKKTSSKALTELSELGEVFEAENRAYEAQNDSWWNALSEREREDAFYAVVKRLHQGEVIDNGSYRHVLYETFGFGPHMYISGMDCGYLELHNLIVTHDEMKYVTQKWHEERGHKSVSVKLYRKCDHCGKQLNDSQGNVCISQNCPDA